MSTTTSTHKNHTGTDPRPKYIFLGIDEIGGSHVYRTVDETIFALDKTGRVQHRFDVSTRRVDSYVKFVENKRGWLDCKYAVDGMGGIIAESLIIEEPSDKTILCHNCDQEFSSIRTYHRHQWNDHCGDLDHGETIK